MTVSLSFEVPRRRAKIVCTLRPATSGPDQVAALIAAGMDVARLKFSHGDRSDHEKVHRTVREAADRSGHAVGIPADCRRLSTTYKRACWRRQARRPVAR